MDLLAILFLARVIVQAVLPSANSASVVTSCSGSPGPGGLIVEIAGIIKFLLEIIAGLAVVAMLASGIFYIVSFQNDALKQRAQRTALSTIVILIIVIFSHTIVSTFIPS